MKTEFITAKRALILLVAVLLSGALMLWLPYEAKTNKGLALLVLVAILWLTEVIPITITAIDPFRHLRICRYQTRTATFCQPDYLPILWRICLSGRTERQQVGQIHCLQSAIPCPW